MNTRANSLQAALSNAAIADVEPTKKTEKKRSASGKGRAVKSAVADKPTAKGSKAKVTTTRSRDNTVMVGGHFPPHVLRQLRMIAAEEDTTNQALIAEALDLLFTRKGKSKIADLSVG